MGEAEKGRMPLGDGVEYDLDGSEARDLAYLMENSCISCDRVLPKYSVRIVPSRYMQERDSYVKSGLAARRLLCTECYGTMSRSHKRRMSQSPLAQDSRRHLVSQVVSSIMQEQ
jgi:hypothetical protein